MTLAYSFLFLSIVSLWLPYKEKIRVWLSAFAIAVICGVLAKVLNAYAVLAIIIFALAVYVITVSLSLVFRVIATLLVLVLGFALKFHYVPGFHNLNILHKVLLTPDAIPYTFYLNFDEAVVGIFILGLTHQLITRGKEWRLLLKQTLPLAALVITIMGLLSFLLGFIRFEPKFPEVTFVWAITNLLIVCVAEEAYFRGFIQKNLAHYWSKYKFGEWSAILLASILFGALHYPGGTKYVCLATIAGIGYGWIYARTKHIEASIFTHFLLNLLQFLLFTYPALASAV